MSRKHNCQHPDRNRSHYDSRLAARGLSKAPPMPTLEYLRKHQSTSDWTGARPWVAENIERYLAENRQEAL